MLGTGGSSRSELAPKARPPVPAELRSAGRGRSPRCGRRAAPQRMRAGIVAPQDSRAATAFSRVEPRRSATARFLEGRAGQGDVMDVMAEAARLLASRRRMLAEHAAAAAAEATACELSEIQAALERIAAGTYGVCENCGHAIGRDRLRALPEVRRCVSCSG
jgi:RNA polymerase-binding transcription factor